MTNLLAKEILQKEEMLLKETKAKLLEQLNRLKVEEVALQRYLLDNDDTKEPQQNSVEDVTFENNKYQTTSSISEETSYTDDPSTLNQMPLENLKPGDTRQIDQDMEEEEEEEDDDQTP